MKTTTTKTSAKNLPEAVANHIKNAMRSTRRNVRVCVVNDDTWTLYANNTLWDGGSHNEYNLFNMIEGTAHFAGFRECANVEIPADCVILEVSHFCGQECDPTVYVRNTDLAAFYGVELPTEFVGLPAEIAADWCNEQAGEKLAGKRATKEQKAFRLAADMLRLLTGVTAAV